MQNKNFSKTSKAFNLALAALLAVLAGVLTFNTGGFAGNTVQAQAAPQRPTDDPVATARQALAGVDSSQFARIKNARVRESFQRTYDAVKAIANNTSKDREQALIETFDREFDNLEAATKATGKTFGDCLDGYNNCQSGCTNVGKLFCGCKIRRAQCNWKASKDYF
jgi:hypothetical protein